MSGRIAGARAARTRGPGAGLEIERKYLLRGLPPLPSATTTVTIAQGYLPGRRLIERLRTEHDGRRLRRWRTVKVGQGLVRTELEEPCSARLFDAMWPFTEGRRVHKRRHRVVAGDLTWEIDEFTDRDLVLAEVELPQAEAAAPLPAWLAPWVVREVTDEPAYVNAVLAR